MQTELPWNVAGIPPEAREAARAAARREGLSVGEWLTRRIIRGQAVAGDDPDFWRAPLPESVPHAELGHRASALDSQDMLARVARSEGETQNAYKTIDHQLKAVARRLETAERNQTENNRAMTQAATQINIAAREQAQAFEQMTANVTALAERVVRLERQAANDGVKDAIKALHQGLSRLADQIGHTASQSAEQITALTGNIDSLASRLLETGEKADATALALDSNLSSLDERLRVVERTAFSSASALDHTMENVEQIRADHVALESAVQRHAASVSQTRDAHDQLHAHVSANEDHAMGAVGRLEEAVARLQGNDAGDAIDHRLQGIEHVLSGIMERLEQTEQAAGNGGVEQTLRELAAGFETSDKRNRDTIEELETAVRDAAAKIAAVESTLSAKTAEAARAGTPPPEAAPAREPILDMPPFHDADLAAFDAVPEASAPPPFAFPDDLQSQHNPAEFGENFGAPLTDAAATPYVEPGESYLAAARRAAAAAAETNEAPRASLGSFSWTFSGVNKSNPPRQGAKRYLMAGSIFGVAVAAALTGVVLTRGTGAPTPHMPIVAKVSAPAAMYRPAPSAAVPAAPSATPSDNSTTDDDSARPSRLPAPSTTATAAVDRNVAPATRSAAAESTTSTTALSAPAIAPKPKPAAESPAQQLASLANTGDPKAQLLLGLKYLTGNGIAANEAEAARWLSRAAQQGEPLAQYRLGTLYERGRGLPADQKQATHWYELAAKQGNRKAMHNLAVAYAEGAGEAKDPVQAAMWFARAANLGLADSQFNLAVLYERGMGVQQSLVDAYKWYLIAAGQGDSESKKRAGALATQLSDSDRNAAQQAALAFKPQELNPSANNPPVLG